MVCRKVGFNNKTGYLYWKMFFTVLFRNTKAIEAAINLAAMYIHFQKQKEYVISAMDKMIKQTEKTGEAELNRKMAGNVAVPILTFTN